MYAYVFYVEADWSDMDWDCDHIDLLWMRSDGKVALTADRESLVFCKGLYETPTEWHDTLTQDLLSKIGYNFRFMRNAALMRRDGSGYARPLLCASKVVWNDDTACYTQDYDVELPPGLLGDLTYEHLEDCNHDTYLHLLKNIIENLPMYDAKSKSRRHVCKEMTAEHTKAWNNFVAPGKSYKDAASA